MIGVMDKVRHRIVDTKNAIIEKIKQMQKPVLDQKIDSMLKDTVKNKRIMVKYLGIGKNIGKKMGGVVGKGLSLLRGLK